MVCISSTVWSQVFPVNVTPQVIPPYSLKLSEYSTSVSDKIILNLLLTDITESNRQVNLKFFVENNAGLSIQSTDVVIGANPIFLDGGAPLRLSNLDLQAYFEFQNLRGISPQQYSVPLPEGLYRFCFEVYDAKSGQQISRKSCTSVYLVLNDPPFLNLPNRGEQVLMRDPQNIIFQWTPRHLNATNVEYEFTLAELWDNQMDPQAAFLASRPLYQTNTFATTLLYGPEETSLLSDKTYGWRVRAMVSDGISETSVFKNNGYSEIYYFTYTGKCAEPEYILAEAKNTTSEKIFWQGVDHLRYNVQYRKKDAENSIWFEGGTLNEYTTIYNLEPGTTYEFRVGGQCLENGPYTYSQIYEFTTILANDKESTYNCGITPEIIITNQDPLERLVTNEVFTAGDFPVTVKEVKGTNGSFSGWGYIVVPYLQDTKLKVSFDNISINTDYQLLEGIVVTDYDENWGDVDSVNDVIEVFEGDNDLESVQLDYDITINDIRVNDDGTITVTDPVTGAISKYPGGDDLVIVDSNGDVYHVDEDGNIRQGEPLAEGGGVDSENTPGVDENGDVSQLSAEGIKVEFIADNTYNYGFDAIPDGQEKQLESYYKQIKDAKGKTYTIINKAVGNGATDKIKAKVTITDSNVSINDLVIKTANGENVKYEISGSNEITLELKGYYAFEHENIYATIQPKDNSKKQTIAGVFSLWHLSKKEVNVTIIPVDGVSLPSISELTSKINAIYGKASVNIKFTIANDFKVDKSLYGGDTVQMGDSGLFNNYTEDQRSIINAYKSKETTSITSYYLFVFGNTIQPSRSDVAGFMPIKRQFGFIFNSNLSKEEEGKDNLTATISHELGHGIFGLEHPFTQLKTSKGATNWLMDYGNGVELSHLDWAQIHNPDFKLYPFQDDEEGEAGIARYQLTPNWEPFSYKASKDYIRRPVEIADLPNGTVYGIKKDGKEYIWNGTNYAYKEETLPIHIIRNPRSSILQIELYWYGDTCKDDKKYRTSWGYIKDKKGFDINEVFNDGIFDSLIAEIELHSDLGCSGSDTNTDRYEDKCIGQNVATINEQRKELESFMSNMTPETSAIDISNALDGKGLCITRKLGYSDIEKLLLRLTNTIPDDVSEEIEESIVKLINSVDADNYEELYKNVFIVINADGDRVLDRLLVELDNSFAFWNDNNSNYFIETLVYVVSKLDGDTNKWDTINAIINNKFDEIGDVEKMAITNILMSINDNFSIADKIPSVSSLFTEMLIEDTKGLKDYQIVFDIATIRSSNRELFASFTQSENQVIYKNQAISDIAYISWVKPKGFNTGYEEFEEHELGEFYFWSKFLNKEENKDVKNLLVSNPLGYFQMFLKELKGYMSVKQGDNDGFWSENPIVDCENVWTFIHHISVNESSKSLNLVDEPMRLELLEKMFACYWATEKDPVFKNTEDALIKLVTSFEISNPIVLKKIEDIGLNKIYEKLSGERLSKFLAWMGSQIMSCNYQKPLREKDFFKKDNITVKDKEGLLALEADLFKFDNFSIHEIGKTTIKVTLEGEEEKLSYNQMVPIYVESSFTFLDQRFEKGSVLYMPLVQAFAMSNSNRNIVLEKGAWVAVDVVSLTVGVGSIKILFSIGNALRKTMVTGDILGSTAGLLANALNEDAIDEKTRFQLNMLAIIASVPLLATTSKNIDDMITTLDNKISGNPKLSLETKGILKEHTTNIRNAIKRGNMSSEDKLTSIISKIKKPGNCK